MRQVSVLTIDSLQTFLSSKTTSNRNFIGKVPKLWRRQTNSVEESYDKEIPDSKFQATGCNGGVSDEKQIDAIVLLNLNPWGDDHMARYLRVGRYLYAQDL